LDRVRCGTRLSVQIKQKSNKNQTKTKQKTRKKQAKTKQTKTKQEQRFPKIAEVEDAGGLR
jgi:hypothetical protein